MLSFPVIHIPHFCNDLAPSTKYFKLVGQGVLGAGTEQTYGPGDLVENIYILGI